MKDSSTRLQKVALITGITGQDGSYLAELLLSKNYIVYGLLRRKSIIDYGNVSHIINRINFIYGDMTDIFSLYRAIEISKPDEVYNLAAQSFVATSWDQPLLTTNIDSIGVLNILEAIRKINPLIKFYQASTSEMFGKVLEIPQTETTPFYPRSPYGVAKLYGHWITKNYYESYGLFACSGILFNHESERRGEEFVTRKITSTIAKILSGKHLVLELGNLNSKRDWGHAEDYVKAMWLMLQQKEPKDYVISSNQTRTVRDFVSLAFEIAGIKLTWQGINENEFATDEVTGKVLVRVNPKFYRPAEVEVLLGDSTKAETELGWKREINFETLVKRMVLNDLKLANYKIRTKVKEVT
jgi:GDPmannose 4,6-dehydratase